MRSSRPFVLLVTLFLLPFLCACTAANARNPPLMGGWSPIKDVKDPYIHQIAEFAVTEHNKLLKHGDRKHLLLLRKVLKGEAQVVEGMNYRLVVEAKYAVTGNAAGRYEAVVWDKSWEKFRQLMSFKPVKA